MPPSNRALEHQLLDFTYGTRRIEPLRADVDAVHDRMATEQAVGVFQVVKALVDRLVAGIGDEPVRLEQPGGTDELVRIPPERRAGGRAAGAQNALVQPVEVFALFGRLQPLAFRRRRIVNEVWLDRVVLLEELR